MWGQAYQLVFLCQIALKTYIYVALYVLNSYILEYIHTYTYMHAIVISGERGHVFNKELMGIWGSLEGGNRREKCN